MTGALGCQRERQLTLATVLEMVEPLEETRTELVFATEPVLSSLENAIPGSGKHASLVELDEIEVRHTVLAQ